MTNKDNATKLLIKYAARTARKRTLKLSNVRWCIGLAIAALLLFVCAWIIGDYIPLLASILISIGGGCVTGLALYYLTNLRSSRLHQLESEYKLLIKLNDLFEECRSYAPYYKERTILWYYTDGKRNPLPDAVTILKVLDEIEKSLLVLQKTAADVSLVKNIPLDAEKIRNCREMYVNAQESLEKDPSNLHAIKNWILHVSKVLLAAADAIHEPIYERETQLRFLNKWYF